jgi:hypothetical protein
MKTTDNVAQRELGAFWRGFAEECAENIRLRQRGVAQGKRFLLPNAKPAPGKPVFDNLVEHLIDLHLENRQLAA